MRQRNHLWKSPPTGRACTGTIATKPRLCLRPPSRSIGVSCSSQCSGITAAEQGGFPDRPGHLRIVLRAGPVPADHLEQQLLVHEREGESSRVGIDALADDTVGLVSGERGSGDAGAHMIASTSRPVAPPSRSNSAVDSTMACRVFAAVRRVAGDVRAWSVEAGSRVREIAPCPRREISASPCHIVAKEATHDIVGNAADGNELTRAPLPDPTQR